jgi:hypothetical protein
MTATLEPSELIISNYKVMRSAAGYYVGRSAYDEDYGPDMEMPFDRVTHYFEYAHEAQEYLDHMEYSWNAGHEQWPGEEDPQLGLVL